MDAVPAPAAPPAPRAPWWPWAVLVLAGIAAYANSFRVPLLLDDVASIAENPSLRRLWPLSDVLSPPANVGLGGRPLANLAFALNYAAGGTAVAGYHAVNLALHLAAGCLLFALLRRTLLLPALARFSARAAEIAGAAALLWTLHPIQTNAVTYLSQRTEVLMALLYLATLYASLRVATGAPARWQIAAVAACLAGMATKEVMVTAPVVIFLFDRTFVAGSFRAAWTQRRSLYLGLAATWALLVFLLADVHERGVGYAAVNAWQYALLESRAVLLYLKLAVWPAPLVFDYGPAVAPAWSAVWPFALGLGTLLVALAALWRRAPRLAFPLLWVFAVLAPTSSFVPVGAQPMAESRMYLPLAGLAAGVAVGAYAWLGRRGLVVVAALAVAGGFATRARNHDYRSALAIWTDTAAKVPTNARAFASVGAAWLEAGKLEHAIPLLQRALQLDPLAAEVHNNLAAALIDAGRPADAVDHFTAALKLKPGVASTHYNFGNLLLQLGRVPEAIAQQQQALLARAAFPEAQCALGNALAAAGRGPDALAAFRAALALQPDLLPAHYGLANLLAQTGQLAAAVPHFEATLRGAPGAWEAHFAFGNVLAQLGRSAEALARYEEVLRLNPGFALAVANRDAVRQAAISDPSVP